MCGLAGFVGPYDEALADRLEAALEHRGPDGGGVFRGDGATLVARRLAILDLAGGAQPMVEGEVAIAFNGEIYNAPELRRSLEAEGVRFATDHSDTEVVLRLYEQRGAEGLAQLNGMFAFVVYDGRRRRLFAARDRFGIKPLYYARPGGGLAFASELRALLHVPGVDRELDRESLFHYLSLRFVPGERSIFAGVRRLPPGHCLEFDLDRRQLDVRRWWRLGFEPDRGPSREEWLSRLRAVLRDAAERWTLSDVPIACSLSGGLERAGRPTG
jgi:asparagine synthase (glutamine-hydrolysing)